MVKILKMTMEKERLQNKTPNEYQKIRQLSTRI